LVGVGWNGGYCALFCDECREGRYEWCSTEKITGATHDGGHAEYIFAPFSSVLSIAEEALETHTYAELAPIMCAGATMYETLRTTKWSPGDVLVIQGLGGLGHLGVQYGRKLGLKVVAVSSGSAKAHFAKQLGADLYIDASSTDAVQTIRSLGGAKLIIATAPSAPAMISLLPALSKEGIMAQVGADFSPAGHKMEVSNPLLVNNRATVMGWTCGASKATENCVRFSVMAGIKPIVETFPLASFPEAYDKLLYGSPNLRCVITFD
ncbi:NAD(P)-binding protein, partial [Exidia glandulosa HHB12029]